MVAVLVTAFALTGCIDDPTAVSADFGIGTEEDPLTFVVQTEDLMLPEELRDDSTDPPTVREVPCGDGMLCPSTEDVDVQCDDTGTCDPAPIRVTVPLGDVFDLETVKASLDFAEVRSFEIRSVDYVVVLNSLNMEVPGLEVFWSTPGAVEGQNLLGTVGPIAVDERPMGQVSIDEGGADALSDHLLNREAKARFFVESDLDLDPGDPWPTGNLEVDVIIRVRITGTLI